MAFHAGAYSIVVPFLMMPLLVVMLAPVMISIAALVRVIQRAGFSGWWVLIVLVPIVNMLALWRFGFGSWPALPRIKKA
jgi:hypothetical protein